MDIKRASVVLALALTLLSSAACAQSAPTAVINYSGGGVSSGGGGGAVNSVTGGSSNLICTPTTGSVVCSGTNPPKSITAGTYTILSGDAGGTDYFNNASGIAVTLPVATTSGFGSGWSLDTQNVGLGDVVITPTTSTINGAATLRIPANLGCTINSDGTNYNISACTAKGRNDLAIDFSGKPGNGQTYTYIAGRPFTLPASLTGSQAHIGTNPTSTLTVTLNKNGSSIGTVAFSTSGTPTITFSSSISFAAGDILTLACPGTADATGADIAITMLGTL